MPRSRSDERQLVTIGARVDDQFKSTDYLRSSCKLTWFFATGYSMATGVLEKSIKDLESSRLMHSYRVNVAGPLAVFRNCLDLVSLLRGLLWFFWRSSR